MDEKILFTKIDVALSNIQLMEEYNSNLANQELSTETEDYKNLKQSLINYPNPDSIGARPLEIAIEVEKNTNSKDFKADMEKSLKFDKVHKSEEMIQKYGKISIFVFGGNHRVHILRNLAIQYKDKSFYKYYAHRPCVVFLNLKDYEIEELGKTSNEIDVMKIQNTEIKVVNWVRKKYLYYSNLLKTKKKEKIWNHEINYFNQKITVGTFVNEMKIKTYFKCNDNQCYSIRKLSTQEEEVHKLIIDYLKKKGSKNKNCLSSLNFLIPSANLEDKVTIMTKLLEQKNYSIADAKKEMDINFSKIKYDLFLKENFKNNIKNSNYEDFKTTSKNRSIFNEYSDLFKKNYKFGANVLFKMPGKRLHATEELCKKKDNFMKRLGQLKNELAEITKTVFSSSTLNKENSLIEKSDYFGEYFDDFTIELFNQSYPRNHHRKYTNLFFADIPYNNSEEKDDKFDYDYNKDFDVLNFCEALYSFSNKNNKQNCIYVIFAESKQLVEIINYFQNIEDIDIYIQKNIYFKNYKSMNFSKSSKKLFNNNYEEFIMFSFVNFIKTDHTSNHNNIFEAFQLNNLVSKLNEKFSPNENIEKDIQNIFNEFLSKFDLLNSSGTVWLAPVFNSFMINNEKLNKFEKSTLFLENLLKSTLKIEENEKIYIEEWCFGSGSLMEVCYKMKFNYVGYDLNVNMFKGSILRLTNLKKTKINEKDIQLKQCIVCDTPIEEKDLKFCEKCTDSHYVHINCFEKH